MNKKYSDEQISWLKENATAKTWQNRDTFLQTFNKKFGANITKSQFNNLILYYEIKITTKQTESLFTKEQKAWLIQNAKAGGFRDCKELTEAYNVAFEQNRNHDNLYSYLHQWGVKLNTKFNESKYTPKMDSWIIENFDKHKNNDELAKKFNNVFGTEKTAAAISHRCIRHLHLKRESNQFKKGECRNAKQVGTIVERKKEPYIKVNEKNDKSAWQPLRKFVYEKHHGKIPKGYCVVPLDNNRHNVAKENLTLIDRRGTATMAKHGWWTDNPVITGDGVQWCNLYYTAKDNNVL